MCGAPDQRTTVGRVANPLLTTLVPSDPCSTDSKRKLGALQDAPRERQQFVALRRRRPEPGLLLPHRCARARETRPYHHQSRSPARREAAIAGVGSGVAAGVL
jgi:hypothetical protein